MLLLFSREDALLYIITIKRLQSTVGLRNTFKAFLFVVPHKMLSTPRITNKWWNCGSVIWWQKSRSPREQQELQGELGTMRKGNTSCLPLPENTPMALFFLLACFLFLSQHLFSCVFLQSYALFHNKYLRVIFGRHRMYLNNSCTSVIDIVPYGRRSRMHSSMSMYKDGLIYHSYHLQNWRSQI